MLKTNSSCKRFRNAFLRPAAVSAIALTSTLLAPGQAAWAAGTLAGTNIENIATASYDTGSGTIDIQSNTSVILVDELLDVTVSSSTPGDVPTTPGATNAVITYRVTNNGNGPETFGLTPNVANSGDDFDPTLAQIVIDTNNNGVYDPGVDTVYVAGTNDPLLSPDQSITIFVLTNIAPTQANGERANVSLVAAATTGTGAPGTTFAGAGEGGGNAVVGSSGADGEASGFLRVDAASVALAKSATVADPFGGTNAVPGATITYTILATVSGAGTLNNLVINDPVPVGTTYVAGSITLQAASLTDAADVDAANFNGTRVSVQLGNVPAGQTRTVTFQTVIQ
ncbi:MAG: DUF11 domain-containing protein [Sphingorhabdus sp.]|nr:DUF11 domain-containing protein [Sphingorhabdus sp.]